MRAKINAYVIIKCLSVFIFLHENIMVIVSFHCFPVAIGWLACLKFCLTLSNCSIFVKVQLPGSYKTGRYIFACKYGWFFSVYAYIKNKLILIFNKLIRICANSTLEESCRFYLSLFSRLLINLLLNSLWKSALYRYSVNPKVSIYRVGSCYSK